MPANTALPRTNASGFANVASSTFGGSNGNGVSHTDIRTAPNHAAPATAAAARVVSALASRATTSLDASRRGVLVSTASDSLDTCD